MLRSVSSGPWLNHVLLLLSATCCPHILCPKYLTVRPPPFARCRELAVQLRRDVKPSLDEQGIKLYLVSIGTWERSKEFVAVTGFPAENLFVDPETATYEALGLVKGVGETFFTINTPLSIKKRMDEGKTGDLQDVMAKWQPWTPPRMDQSLQQGEAARE